MALTWIEKRGKWSVFVENRVKDINNSTKPSQWEHVPDHANPADLLSRGCNPTQLKLTVVVRSQLALRI